VSILLKKSPVFVQLNNVDSGLFSFASTTLILSLYNIQTRGINAPNVVVGMAIFCGGLAQLLAGMWEFPRNNAFGAAGEPRSTDNSLMSHCYLTAF
jgi:succinate-acetate transporter protein